MWRLDPYVDLLPEQTYHHPQDSDLKKKVHSHAATGPFLASEVFTTPSKKKYYEKFLLATKKVLMKTIA